MIASCHESANSTNLRAWCSALLYALPVTVLVLSLFYYWFAIADRHVVFLYYHDMDPVVPGTSPFSKVTSSRHWMAGLVASGAVMVLNVAANWLLGRLVANYRPPAWWRVWAVCALPLLVGIPVITMTLNQPTLPLPNAAQTTLATLIGLGLALLPGTMAAQHPVDLVWLAADGWWLMQLLVTVADLENMPRSLARGGTWWVRMAIMTLVVAVVWLLIVTGLRFWRRTSVPSTPAMFVAGLCVAYLLMPLVHHGLAGTDGYHYISNHYISNSNNFFADKIAFQFAAWLIAAAMAAGATRLRQSLAEHRSKPQASAA